jgi:hypothetical protein
MSEQTGLLLCMVLMPLAWGVGWVIGFWLCEAFDRWRSWREHRRIDQMVKELREDRNTHAIHFR